ncbi:MAG: diguanylate cyclase [Acidimicrobiales bacterium]|nr:diguanylate cyclase [Acidimicrobiales bacterium]
MARAWVAAIADPGTVHSAEAWIRSGDGTWSHRRFDYCDLADTPLGVVLLGITTLQSGTAAPPETPERSAHDPAHWSILRLGPLGGIMRAEGTLAELYGRTADELVGQNGLDLVHPDDHEALLDAWADVVEHDSPGRSLRQRVMHLDGTSTWVLASIGRPDSDGTITIHDLDISDQLAAEEALRSSELRVRSIASEIPVSVFVCDQDGRFDFTNDACHALVGDSETIVDVLGGFDSTWATMLETTQRDGNAEASVETDDGRILRIRCQHPLPDGTVSGVIDDVTTSTRWRVEASRDALTGLSSRSAISNELARRIADGQRSTIAFVDLDGFKRVNDDYGHDEGDRVLALVGEALQALVRDGDQVGRWGGDEFILLLDELPHPAQHDLRRRIDEAMAACGAGGASAGFTSLHADLDVRAHIDRADRAMYEDKRASQL